MKWKSLAGSCTHSGMSPWFIQPDLGDDERVHQACLSALKDSRRFVTCSSRIATRCC